MDGSRDADEHSVKLVLDVMPAWMFKVVMLVGFLDILFGVQGQNLGLILYGIGVVLIGVGGRLSSG